MPPKSRKAHPPRIFSAVERECFKMSSRPWLAGYRITETHSQHGDCNDRRSERTSPPTEDPGGATLHDALIKAKLSAAEVMKPARSECPDSFDTSSPAASA